MEFPPTPEHITSSKILIIHFINSVTAKINCFTCHDDRYGATIASYEFWSAMQAALGSRVDHNILDLPFGHYKNSPGNQVVSQRFEAYEIEAWMF